MNQFKRIEFVKEYLSIRKIFSYANSISKLDIDKAISQTKCFQNPYRIYFSLSSSSQKDQWLHLMKKWE